MLHWRIVRGYTAGILALALFALTFLAAIALGAYLGVLVERQIGIGAIYIALPAFAVLLLVLLRVVASQLKGGALGRALERFANGSDA